MLDSVLLVHAVFDAAFDIHLTALLQVFASDFAGLAEQLDAVPFGLFDLLAFLVLAHAGGGQAQGADGHAARGVSMPFGFFDLLSFLVLAHAGSGQAQGADGHAARGVFDFGVVAQVADQDDFVDAACHEWVPLPCALNRRRRIASLPSRFVAIWPVIVSAQPDVRRQPFPILATTDSDAAPILALSATQEQRP